MQHLQKTGVGVTRRDPLPLSSLPARLRPGRQQVRFDTIIRNGTVVTATDTFVADIGINGDKVSALFDKLPTENAAKVIDAAGLLVIPGAALPALVADLQQIQAANTKMLDYYKAKQRAFA